MNSQNNLINDMYEKLSENDLLMYVTHSIHLDFIEIINNKMLDLDYNQKCLADKLKVSEAYISKLFSAEKLLNLKTIAKIQKILDIKFYISTVDHQEICEKCNFKKSTKNSKWRKTICFPTNQQQAEDVA